MAPYLFGKIWSTKGIQLKKADDYLQLDQLSTILADCKSLYDALATVETSGLQLTERLSAIEAAGCKVRLGQTNCQVRWVNSDRQLADGLTKTDVCDHLRKFQRQGFWKIISDPEFVSAKKKRKELTQSIINKRIEQKQWAKDFSEPTQEVYLPLSVEEVQAHNDSS